MDTSREEMCKSLNDWFLVFYNENCVSQDQREKSYLLDLTDGVAMALALYQLAPDYFTGTKNGTFFTSVRIKLNWRESEIEFCHSLQKHGIPK